jgi:hypothetical protein
MADSPNANTSPYFGQGLLSPNEPSSGLLAGSNQPNTPMGMMEKYQLFSWLEKNHPEMLTYNNNEPAALLQIMRGKMMHSDRDLTEPPANKQRINRFTLPEQFQNLPSENTFGQRREMPRPENFSYPRLDKGYSVTEKKQEVERLLQEIGGGTYY